MPIGEQLKEKHMLKVLGLALVFIAIAIISMAGISSLSSIDNEINETALSEPMAGAYNFSQTSTELGFSIFSGGIIFLGIAFFFGMVAVCFAALRS